ncbi:hypothetical protein GC177_08120 [bacterium]|nr:hypothetical protein [bacterium]
MTDQTPDTMLEAAAQAEKLGKIREGVTAKGVKWQVGGEALPLAQLTIPKGVTILAEPGRMVEMDNDIDMHASLAGKGLGGAFKRMIGGEGLALVAFDSLADGQEVVISAAIPGEIITRELKAGETILCQPGAFIACEDSVDVSFDRKFRPFRTLISGEGLLMQKITGPGLVMMAAGGVAHERVLQPGEKIRVSSGKIAYYDEGVNLSVEVVGNLATMVFGGEGFTVATLTNNTDKPLHICTQSTTARELTAELLKSVGAQMQTSNLLEALR